MAARPQAAPQARLLAHVEASRSLERLVGHLDGIDGRARRAMSGPLDHRRRPPRWSPSNVASTAPSGRFADPAGNSESPRLLRARGAEEHALHLATNHHVSPDHVSTVRQDGGMDAAEALKEIGFWLERERAVTYKVEAFRKAAAIIEDLSDDRAREAARERGAQAYEGHRRPYVHRDQAGRRG